PFEYLGGLSLAVRRLDGASPSLYISDLREPAARVATAGQFLAAEMRARVLNPHWITGQKAEGYAGTLEILNAVNNLWGWQVADPASVRADQWQAVHDTFVNDVRELDLKNWFDRENPMAQAQVLERLLEAIRKGYWDAGDETRREISERWAELAAAGVQAGAEATRDFAAQMAAGFGLSLHAPAPAALAQPPASAGEQAQVRGQVMEMAEQSSAAPPDPWRTRLGLAALVLLLLGGAVWQARANVTTVARF
ncbi:MAG TPA: cobaltochelatase subunit CobN, partial [Xanthobacteraceae bacterium]|nr:cobaltochelatase subunit CobN [Xanthobacteraceae bacterium]